MTAIDPDTPPSRPQRRPVDILIRHPRAAAFVAGVVAATGFAPLGFWFGTLIGLAAVLHLIARSGSARQAAWRGWLFGVGLFVLGLNWIATAFTYQAAMPAWLGWVAVVLLSLFLALYPALAAGIAWRIGRARPGGDAGAGGWPLVLAFAGAWVLAEWLRAWVLTGFAWNPLAAVLVARKSAPPLLLTGVLPVIGTYALSAAVVMIAGLWALMLGGERRARWIALPATALLVIPLPPAPDVARGVAVTVVQPNIDQSQKWDEGFGAANFAKLAALSRAAADAPPRLLLWPEAAIPDYLERGYPAFFYDRSPDAARARLTALLRPGDRFALGALRLDVDDAGSVTGARNAVLTLDAAGQLGPAYDKAHLVPFGEYLPLRPLLSAIGLSRLAPGDLDFAPGPGPRTLDLSPFGRMGVQICYEIIFSGQVVDRAARPDFLFNPSNDAWFGAWGPPQHLAQARLRAIEEGMPVVRATPTGISAVIDAHGSVTRSIDPGAAGRIDTRLPGALSPTLFARFGNAIAVAVAAALMLAGWGLSRRRG